MSRSAHALARRAALVLSLAALPLATSACQGARVGYPTAQTKLGLSRVVLYRNGVGYFERAGQVEGDLLSIRVRKDQVNDLLKSLTIVERSTGRAVSVSMPLDPRTWANAALAKLAPGRGSLHEVLDALRGADVSLSTTSGGASGRIVMVERLERASEAGGGVVLKDGGGGSDEIDYKVTLLEDGDFKVVRLSQVQSVSIKDGDLALQFHRSLDASAGEGMFQQVDVAIRLHGQSHDLAVSYVVAAPMWKPTYRIVLPEAGKGKALLQGWAVVDNTSGEDWRDVKLSLTSGSPIAFRYDLHTPRDIYRDDLSSLGGMKRARAAVGETVFDREPPAPQSAPMPSPAAEVSPGDYYDGDEEDGGGYALAEGKAAPAKDKKKDSPKRVSAATRAPAKPMGGYGGYGPKAAEAPGAPPPPPPPPPISVDTLAKSALANTKARAVSGLVQFDLQDKVTVPDGTSTMVAVVNQTVEGEETYLFKPGGAGVGFEQNPYRVIRFKNTTPFVLEPGPISIYAGGSFVGEGLSETVGTGVSATIPFAVEPNLFVSTNVDWGGNETRLVKIVRGVIEIETFSRRTTTYELRAQKRDSALAVLVRHSRAGTAYQLEPRPEGTEDLVDAYLIPIALGAGATDAKLSVVEQTPSRSQISILDGRMPLIFDTLLAGNLPPELRKKIEPIATRRQEIGRIDTQIDGLKRQQYELDARAAQTRANLDALKKDTSGDAAKLRKDLGQRLDQFTKDGDKLGREIVELQNKRLSKKIELEDMLQSFEFTAPERVTTPAKK